MRGVERLQIRLGFCNYNKYAIGRTSTCNFVMGDLKILLKSMGLIMDTFKNAGSRNAVRILWDPHPINTDSLQFNQKIVLGRPATLISDQTVQMTKIGKRSFQSGTSITLRFRINDQDLFAAELLTVRENSDLRPIC